MVLSKLKKMADRLKLKKEPTPRTVLGEKKEIVVHLKDPYRQPDKPHHRAFKVAAPFTIEPSSTREVRLKKVNAVNAKPKKAKR